MIHPMKKSGLVPRNVPGLGWVMQGWIGWGVSCSGEMGWFM